MKDKSIEAITDQHPKKYIARTCCGQIDGEQLYTVLVPLQKIAMIMYIVNVEETVRYLNRDYLQALKSAEK